MNLEIRVNGEPTQIDPATNESLLSILRNQLGLVGTKASCERGECGSCTVLDQGRPVLSCIVLPQRCVDVETIEGLATQSQRLRECFAEEGAFQCGFCTPGQIVRGIALLRAGLPDSEDELRRAISGNICRCTGYQGIARALRRAAESPN